MLILWHSLQRSRHLGTSGALYIQNKVKMWKCRFKILNSKLSAKSKNFNVFHYKSMWMMLAKIRDSYIALDRVWIPIGTTVHTFSLKSWFSSYLHICLQDILADFLMIASLLFLNQETSWLQLPFHVYYITCYSTRWDQNLVIKSMTWLVLLSNTQ